MAGAEGQRRRGANDWLLLAIMLACLLISQQAQAERLKDLASIQGVRGNQLIGYGLVVGLDGSGDRTSQAPFTVQSLKNMLGELGVNVEDLRLEHSPGAQFGLAEISVDPAALHGAITGLQERGWRIAGNTND